MNAFKDITDIWFKEVSTTNEESRKSEIKTGSEAGIGANAWVIKLKTFLQTVITSESKETEMVRMRIKNNINEIIQKLNVILTELRFNLDGYFDILFVIDGTEKINYELSKRIFIHDAPLLNQINAHFIFSSPVFGLYDINKGADFFTPLTLPMVRLNNEHKIKKFAEIITKRIEKNTFFESDQILQWVVKKSGGCVRQLLQITHNCLVTSRGKKITEETLSKTLSDMGRRLYDQLNTEHRDVLLSGYNNNNKFVRGDKPVKEMLFNLTLLAYNGDTCVNPIILPFVRGDGNHFCD